MSKSERAEELQQIADASEDLINIVPLNQDKKESIEAAAATAEDLLGDLPVDYIINNAAYVSLSISFAPMNMEQVCGEEYKGASHTPIWTLV